MRIRHITALVSLLCFTVTGCTTISPGEATPATSQRTPDSTPPSSDQNNLPSSGAPKVEDPLDTTRFQQNPCLTLTAKQAQELNLPTTGKPDEIPYGVGCEWYNGETRGEVSIALLTGNDRGLSAIYAADQRGEYPYFNKLPNIEGYPAVARDTEDRRPMGICIVDVGVTDQLVVDVYLALSQANVGKKEPCEWAAKVAGMAVQTMKEGA